MRLRRVIWNPWQAMGSLEEWRIEALKHFCHKQSLECKGEAKRNQPWSILDDSNCSYFWSTSRSPNYAYNMSFESLGSQQSNASSRVQFGAEMRKLQPLEDNCIKLKEGFRKVLRNHHFVAEWFRSLFAQCYGVPLKLRAAMEAKHLKLEVHFAKVLKQLAAMKKFRSSSWVPAKFRRPHLSPAKWSLVLPDICNRHLEIFFIRFLLPKCPNSLCKSPMIGFLSF